MKSTITTPRFLFLSLSILIAAMSRLLPHIPNFTPIAAMALFGGVYFRDKPSAILVPLLAMLLSDCCLELIMGRGFHDAIAYVYVSITLITIIGMYLKKNINVKTVLVGSLLSSVLFFIITNFGHWAAYGVQGFSGLLITYAQGLPFFRITLAGDLFYNSILFGAFYYAQRRVPSLVQA